MKNSLRDRFPLTLETHEEVRELWAEFKKYVRSGEIGYAPSSQNPPLTGAGLFVDYLCGIKPEKKTSGTSYRGYPDKPWPS